MNVLSLFAGVGGFDLGLERAGMKVVAQCEIDPFCQKVLAKHWPDTPCHDNVQSLTVDWLVKEGIVSMTGKLKKLTPLQVIEAIDLYNAGLSLADLSSCFSVSRQSMHDLLKRRISLRPQKRFGPENHFFRGGNRAVDSSHNAVEAALKTGLLVRKPCEVCGISGEMSDGRSLVQAHHDDYGKPLSVRWLCQPHHHEWHKHNTAKDVEPAKQIDVICGGFP